MLCETLVDFYGSALCGKSSAPLFFAFLRGFATLPEAGHGAKFLLPKQRLCRSK